MTNKKIKTKPVTDKKFIYLGKEIKITDRTYETLPTKSSKIRKLTEDGFNRSQVSIILNIRYQHVRNVLVTPIKTPKGNNK